MEPESGLTRRLQELFSNLREGTLRLRKLFLPSSGLMIGDIRIHAKKDASGNTDPHVTRSDGTEQNLTGEVKFCRATADLTLTTSDQSITGDGNSSKVRVLLPTIGEWLVTAYGDFDVSATDPDECVARLYVDDSGTPETGSIVFGKGQVNRGTPGQQWVVTTTAANTPVELKARKLGAGGTAKITATHTTLSASIGAGGGSTVETTDHGLLDGLGDTADHAWALLLDGSRAGSTGQAQDFGSTGIKADVIAESTGAAGVTIDGLLIKDSGIPEAAVTAHEAAIEGAIDTLANLTSVQGLTVTLADAGADALFGWDDTASAYENLSKAEALAVLNVADGADVTGSNAPQAHAAAEHSAANIIPNANQAYTGDMGITGALTATSYGGITEANLLDKSASEAITGSWDFGGAAQFEIPNDNAPTAPNADGEMVVDLSVSDWSHGLLEYYGGELMGVVAMPITQFTSPTDNYVVTYNAANDEFELQAGGGGGGEWTDTGTVLHPTETTDDVVIGNTSPVSNAKFTIDGDANQIQCMIHGHSTQTTDLFVVETSANADYFSVGTASPLIDMSPAGISSFNFYEVVKISPNFILADGDGLIALTGTCTGREANGGTIAYLAGLGYTASAVALSGSITTSDLAGMTISVASTGAANTVTMSTGIRVTTPLIPIGATTWVENYGIRVNDQGPTTTTTAYGIAIDDITAATNKRPFYQAGASDDANHYNVMESNTQLFSTTGSFGGGIGVLGIRDAGTNPGTNPSNGGVLYSDSGALKWRGSSGTVTQIAAA